MPRIAPRTAIPSGPICCLLLPTDNVRPARTLFDSVNLRTSRPWNPITD
jgi:hypothetical protein